MDKLEAIRHEFPLVNMVKRRYRAIENQVALSEKQLKEKKEEVYQKLSKVEKVYQ